MLKEKDSTLEELCRNDWAKTITSQKTTIKSLRYQLVEKDSELTKLKNHMQHAARGEGSGLEHFTK